MDPQVLISIVSAAGVGGLVTVLIKNRLDRSSELNSKLKMINEEKYRTILIYMSIYLDPDNKFHFVLNDKYLDLIKDPGNIKAYCYSKLTEYYFQSMLYASDEVMRGFARFMESSNRVNYILAAQNMRQDLWHNMSKLGINEILGGTETILQKKAEIVNFYSENPLDDQSQNPSEDSEWL